MTCLLESKLDLGVAFCFEYPQLCILSNSLLLYEYSIPGFGHHLLIRILICDLLQRCRVSMKVQTGRMRCGLREGVASTLPRVPLPCKSLPGKGKRVSSIPLDLPSSTPCDLPFSIGALLLLVELVHSSAWQFHMDQTGTPYLCCLRTQAQRLRSLPPSGNDLSVAARSHSVQDNL